MYTCSIVLFVCMSILIEFPLGQSSYLSITVGHFTILFWVYHKMNIVVGF